MNMLKYIVVTVIMILSYIRSTYAGTSCNSRAMRMSTASSGRLPNKMMQTNRYLKSSDIIREETDRLKRCMTFLDTSPEPFHVVSTVINRLHLQGFTEIDESCLWKKGKMIQKGGKYYFTRNGSTIVAFTVGSRFSSGSEGGFKIIGAHTDSPTLKLKPKSKKCSNGFIQLNVECYGGGLWHSWFDRELSIAGRVIVRDSDNQSFKHHLVKIDRGILRIPNLCIHLKTPEEREAFKINKEDHLMPILCEEVVKAITSTNESTAAAADIADSSASDAVDSDSWSREQPIELLELISKQLSCNVSDIADFELSLYDVQKATTSGLQEEFLCSSRIDNLASCFAAVEALEYHAEHELHDDIGVSMIALFDHEEVGSESNAGAGSTIMRDAVMRISNALEEDIGGDDTEVYKAALTKSMILSVDMAHAVHPNYANKHDKNHAPKMNHGMVIKSNTNQRYSTNGLTGFFVRELCRNIGVPVQEFSVRNDCPCGSTIGPIISATTGIRAVDLGMPMLSMHSIRESMGSSDLTFAYKLFQSFFKSFHELDSKINIK